MGGMFLPLHIFAMNSFVLGNLKIKCLLYLCLTRVNTPKRSSDGASASLCRLAKRQPAFASTPCSSTVRTAFGSFGVFGAVFCFVISTFSFAGPKNHVFPCQAKVLWTQQKPCDNMQIVFLPLFSLTEWQQSIIIQIK